MEEDKKPTREEFETMLRTQLEQQFQRGMYTAAYGLTGAINELIDTFKKKPRKKLADYQKVLGDIAKLCEMKVKNPDKPKEE